MGCQEQLRHFGLGQIVSLFTCVSSICSKYLAINDASVPAFQSFCCYLLLTLIYCLVRLRLNYQAAQRKNDWASSAELLTKSLFFRPSIDLSHHNNATSPSTSPSASTSSSMHKVTWLYLVLAIIDVQANVLIISAFRYAHFATVGLLLRTTLPMVTLLSIYVLNRRYRANHYLGCAFSCVGTLLIFLTDYNASEASANEVKGDYMCLAAAMLYAVSNIGQEWCVSQGNGVDSRIEFLRYLGFFATLLTGLQVALLERTHLQLIQWTSLTILLPFSGFVLAIVLFYTLTSLLLRVADSLLFNLSLLTADIFGVLAATVLFQESVSALYVVALGCQILGIFTYSLTSPQDNSDENASTAAAEEMLPPRYSLSSTGLGPFSMLVTTPTNSKASTVNEGNHGPASSRRRFKSMSDV